MLAINISTKRDGCGHMLHFANGVEIESTGTCAILRSEGFHVAVFPTLGDKLEAFGRVDDNEIAAEMAASPVAGPVSFVWGPLQYRVESDQDDIPCGRFKHNCV